MYNITSPNNTSSLFSHLSHNLRHKKTYLSTFSMTLDAFQSRVYLPEKNQHNKGNIASDARHSTGFGYL